MENTEAEVGIEFNKTASAEQIPQDEAVTSALVEAVNNPNNTFNLTVEPDSIQVLGK